MFRLKRLGSTRTCSPPSIVRSKTQGSSSARSTESNQESSRGSTPRLPETLGLSQWKASDKQRELILKIAEDNHLELEVVESIAEEMFGTSSLPSLNKIQSSGLIDELLVRYSTKPRREASAPNNRWSTDRRASR